MPLAVEYALRGGEQLCAGDNAPARAIILSGSVGNADIVVLSSFILLWRVVSLRLVSLQASMRLD